MIKSRDSRKNAVNQFLVEMKDKENGTKIIPLMVSPCGVFEDSWLSKYQAAGNPDGPMTSLVHAAGLA